MPVWRARSRDSRGAWPEAREERADSSNAPFVELDDLDGRSIPALQRLRTWRIVRLVLLGLVAPTAWIVAPHLPGVVPVFALAACLGSVLGALMTVYLIVHVQKALQAARYEAGFAGAFDAEE